MNRYPIVIRLITFALFLWVLILGQCKMRARGGARSPAAVAGAPPRALVQPELKQSLERAPRLETESLGEPAKGVNVWERWMVPNRDETTWDVLQIYFKEYCGPTWL